MTTSKTRMTVKVKVADLQEAPLTDTLLAFLQKNKGYAYTRKGLMVDVLGVPAQDIDNKSFSLWKKGQSQQYTQVAKALDTLVQRKLVVARPHGPKNGRVYHAA